MVFMEIAGITISGILVSHFLNEYQEVKNSRERIPIRIHVNGIRGKTSVTRMIGSILRPHLITTTKTTGSEPKIIYSDGHEVHIKRNGAANIKEQMNVMNIAAKEKSEAIVFECMAVEPLLQKILEEMVMKSTIGVITNIRYDHEDVMGETLEEIATSLGNTIPYNSILVIPKDIQSIDVLLKIASERNTVVHFSDVNDVPKGYSKKFDFMNYDENIAIVLKIAEILKIKKENSLKDMLSTKHDIGKGGLYTRIVENKKISLLNSFANNDVQSLIIMLNQIKFEKYAKKIGILSHRDDRMRRSIGMIPFILDYGFDSVVINSDSDLIEKDLRISGFKGEILTLDSKNNRDEIINKILKLSNKNYNYWIGLANIKTNMADAILAYYGVN